MACDRADRAADARAAAPSFRDREKHYSSPLTWRAKRGNGGYFPRQNGQRTEEAEDQRKAGLAEQEGKSRAKARHGPRKAQLREEGSPPGGPSLFESLVLF